MGNLLPAFTWLVPTVPGLAICYRTGNYLGIGFILVLLGILAGLIALNQFGFYENKPMRWQLQRLLIDTGEVKAQEFFFVGYASHGFSSMLDAHEDVGFLVLEKERLVFVSEVRRVEVALTSGTRVRFRWNPHSFFGLGRWIAVESPEKSAYFEPREMRTLLANRKFSRKLKAKIEALITRP